MDLDDLKTKMSNDHAIGADLSKLSVEELKALIRTLQDELVRINETIVKKESQLSAADSVFKS